MDTLDDFVSDLDVERDREIELKIQESLIKFLKEFLEFLEAKKNANSRFDG